MREICFSVLSKGGPNRWEGFKVEHCTLGSLIRKFLFFFVRLYLVSQIVLFRRKLNGMSYYFLLKITTFMLSYSRREHWN